MIYLPQVSSSFLFMLPLLRFSKLNSQAISSLKEGSEIGLAFLFVLMALPSD